jgi:hypothetical protein
VQLLVGAMPQTYGGSDKDIKTAAGQEQALKTAMGVLWLYWNLLRAEWSAAAEISVDCFAENATDDEYRVTKSESSSDFQNEPIRLADLNGKADARPEANQDYPIGYEQQRQLYKELFMMASGKEPNPLVLEVLDTFEARRQAMRYLGPPDMELPETPFRYKVLADIDVLIQQPPIPTNQPDPADPTQMIMKPPVEPDPDFDDLDVSIDTVTRYAVKNFKEIPVGSPPFMNLKNYLKLAVMMKAQKQIAGKAGPQLLNAGVPGWGGDLGGPMKPPGAGAPPPGAGAPAQ